MLVRQNVHIWEFHTSSVIYRGNERIRVIKRTIRRYVFRVPDCYLFIHERNYFTRSSMRQFVSSKKTLTVGIVLETDNAIKRQINTWVPVRSVYILHYWQYRIQSMKFSKNKDNTFTTLLMIIIMKEIPYENRCAYLEKGKVKRYIDQSLLSLSF